jgi:internalin A
MPVTKYFPRIWSSPKQKEQIFFKCDPALQRPLRVGCCKNRIIAPAPSPSAPLAPSLYITTFFSSGGIATGVCVDSSGNVYISDPANNRIIKVDIYGNVSTYVTLINEPYGICVDNDGNLYVTFDRISYVSKIDTSKNITTFAGISENFGNDGDGGLATDAKMDRPMAICVDNNKNVYIADRNSNCIRKVASDGKISTVAAGTLSTPQGVCLDSLGNLYISDTNNFRILKVSPSGNVSIFAGIVLSPGGPYSSSHENQLATDVPIGRPVGICADSSGNIYFSSSHNRIRKVDTSSRITSIVGNGTLGFSGDNGLATMASIRSGQLGIDASKNLYLCDGSNNRVRIYYA